MFRGKETDDEVRDEDGHPSPPDLTSEVNAHLPDRPDGDDGAAAAAGVSFLTLSYPPDLAASSSTSLVLFEPFPDDQRERGGQGLPETDEDGDLVVPRNAADDGGALVDVQVRIKHALRSGLADVGTQIWRGAFCMADLLITMASSGRDDPLRALEWSSPSLGSCGRRMGVSVWEVGSGTGLAAIVAATLPCVETVWATDLDRILPLLKFNLEANLRPEALAKVRVLPFDATSSSASSGDPFELADLVIGADLIYDAPLTAGLVRTLGALVRQRSDLRAAALVRQGPDTLGTGDDRRLLTAIFSVEKRHNFVRSGLRVADPAFEYFMDELSRLEADLAESHNAVRLDISCESVIDRLGIRQHLCYERNRDLVFVNVVAYYDDEGH